MNYICLSDATDPTIWHTLCCHNDVSDITQKLLRTRSVSGHRLSADNLARAFRLSARKGQLSICQKLNQVFSVHPSHAASAWQEAACGGHLSICQWVEDNFSINNYIGDNMLLRTATQWGHLSICQWYVRRHENAAGMAFAIAAKNGHLSLCKWMYNTCATKPDLGAAFRSAAENGHLRICQWIMDSVGPTSLRQDAKFALTDTVSNGHFSMCQWLIDRFDLTEEDFTSSVVRHEVILRGAAACGHLPMCQWFVDRFEWSSFSVHQAFIEAASNDHLHVCQWLASEFEIPKLQRAFYLAAVHNHLSMCRWLADTFTYTLPDICERNNAILHEVVERGLYAMCRWLVSRFALTAADICSNDNFALQKSVVNSYLAFRGKYSDSADEESDDLAFYVRVCQDVLLPWANTQNPLQENQNEVLKDRQVLNWAVHDECLLFLRWLMDHFKLNIRLEELFHVAS